MSKRQFNQYHILSLMWLTYGSYYLCRVNLSVAQIGIMAEFGWTKTKIGILSSVMLGSYAIGQWINGYLADRIGPRRLMTVGMIGSAVANVLFCLTGHLWLMAVLWGVNGLFQATGWPSSIRLLGNTLPAETRGRMMGWWGSCYQIGNVLSWLLSGFLAEHYGWRTALWVPALYLFTWGIAFYFISLRFMAEGIPDHPPIRDNRNMSYSTITSPTILLLAGSYFCLGFVRYGYLNWIVVMLAERYHFPLAVSAIKASVLPLWGALGAICAGILSDKLFHGRRAPMVFLLYIILFIGIMMASPVFVLNEPLVLLGLGMIGFAIYGNDLLIGGPMVQDFAPVDAIGVAAGFVDGLMYAGGIFSGFFLGWIIDNFGWGAGSYCLLGAAAIGSAFMIPFLRKHTVKCFSSDETC